ncbi:MAG: hypothetical protein RQ936_04470 [Gammaproteobacteria bacterium]|nr:hypothetical protein [Gammaproteobacteria bacterium]
MLKKILSNIMLLIWINPLAFANAVERDRPVLLAIGELSFLTGLEYQQADYGTTDSTDLWRIPLGLGYRLNNFSLFASMPLLHAGSDGNIIATHKTSRTFMHSGRNSVSGIGDLTLSGTFYFTPQTRNTASYHLTGGVKFGTADADKGLGTGEDDLFIEAGAYKNIDSYVLSAELGYEISGDAADFNYKNALYGTAGLAKWTQNRGQLGGYLYFSEAQVSGLEEPLELNLFYTQFISKDHSVYYFISKGLSHGSPDYALGGNIQFYY